LSLSFNSKKDKPLPVVGIPSLLRDFTNGQRSVSVEGATVRQVIENLEKLYPGIQERLCDGDRLRPSIAVIVDGNTSTLKLRHPLQESSEVHFVISISGGTLELLRKA
jgi:molybdopterin synthase sulfur carrier subunit